eukprot:gb/GECG01011968.1/.p1 GENE.gb/GECG01011968.1/~~gb/GECG01011968.1/.p1  ORF type:complete len:272 (+),score=31.85 gb/GECG01011968.1/:1-816(+)
MSSGGSWESLRLEARKYEVHINQQLQELSQKADSLRHEEKRKSPTPMTTIHQDTATTSSHNNDRYRRKGGSSGYDEESGPLLGASGGEDQDEDTCTRLLHDTDASLHHMEHLVHKLKGHPVAEQSSTSGAFAQRMREVYQGFRREYNKLYREIQHQKELRELFEGAYGRGGRNEVDAGTNSLLRERNSLEQSTNLTDEVLSQAMETHSTLRRDRLGISNATSQLTTAVGKLPGVQTLIRRIQSRQTRDNTIIGLVIAFCISFMLWYVLRKF